jgi:hypothetical protein
MTHESLPEIVPIVPGSRELPPPLHAVLADPTAHLVLVVAAEADDGTIGTVIDLAEARAAAGHATVLADAAFDDARLHQFLRTSNVEGLADVFEFGASLPRVVTRPEGRGFWFIPGGPYVPSPREVLGSARWDRIAGELAVDQKTMLVFTLASTPGVDELSRRIGRAVLVGGPDRVGEAAAVLDPECEVAVIVQPAGHAVGHGSLEAQELSEPPVFRTEASSARLSPLLWVLLAVAVGAVGWVGYEYVLTPGTGEAAVDTVPPVEVVEPQPTPEPVETPIGFSVAVEAHQDLDTGEDRVARLQRSAPGILFYLAPTPIRGELWYRVLAGPVTSHAEGVALMEQLVSAGLMTDYAAWAVRPTEFAFLLGEYDSPTEAGNRVVVLAQRDIPAYIVTLRYEPGEPRYRVYGGAFENRPAATMMGEMLAEAGVDAPLVRRVGEPVAVSS